MSNAITIISWLCQLYLAFFFFRSAYRKSKGFERVSAEFSGWGYPYPDQVTFFLIAVWILCATGLLVPLLVGLAALVLLVFMFIAFGTLVIHGEYRRLCEPSVPIGLLIIVIIANWEVIFEVLANLS